MNQVKVLNFNGSGKHRKNEFDTGNLMRQIIELRLKALIARARLACHQMSEDEKAGLEKQAMVSFFESQKKSTPAINAALGETDNRDFQRRAVRIAVEIGRGNFGTAADVAHRTVETFSEVALMKIERWAEPAKATLQIAA